MTGDRLLARRCRDVLARLTAACGCPVRACEVLVALGALPRGTASVSELAQQTALSLPTASRAVGALEGRGLVRTVVDPRDRRRLAVAVTQRGQAAVAGVCEPAGCEVLAGAGSDRAGADAHPSIPAGSSALWQAPDELRRAWELRCVGSSAQEASLLAALAQGPADVTELARACGLPRSTVGFALDGLARAGAVMRRDDPADARRSVYCVSDASDDEPRFGVPCSGNAAPRPDAGSCPPASTHVLDISALPDAPTSQLNSHRFGTDSRALL